jgi:hypothetical protein
MEVFMTERHGINPVTFRGLDRFDRELGLTIGRLWFLNNTTSDLTRRVSVVFYREPTGAPGDDSILDNILGEFSMSEENFLVGLGHLFPAGETRGYELTVPGVNRELLQALKGCMVLMEKAGADDRMLNIFRTLIDRAERI